MIDSLNCNAVAKGTTTCSDLKFWKLDSAQVASRKQIPITLRETDASEMSSPERMFLILAIANVQKKKGSIGLYQLIQPVRPVVKVGVQKWN